MRCIYYLSPTLKSTHQISDDLHSIGVDDWFLHIHSKDESGLVKEHLHSSNYFETLDFIREGFIGAGIGFVAGLVFAGLIGMTDPFAVSIPWYAFAAIVFLVTCFGAWVGGLTGVMNENKKIAHFHDDIKAGKYLVLIYAKEKQVKKVQEMMTNKHPEAQLAAIDPHFLNPFADLQMVRA
ncbi:hypothetical protein QGM61_10425 [Pseudohongiella sp. SYSU M77423]|uniref:hypothetical protein n=1 Tax=unclassified Pseudohongiella TaxID=2629611 RepID=UPI000E93A973|nr:MULTISPECIES: hypothetical protein [unclassified Pseudohongiella]MDH7944234.1 hypothetical protein [Pseudohongiella sp. SYSU M77423]MEC8859686.1 hypothetical protein [Pseudomonadota bacterium]HBX38526.1 hypothetical protein [Pseudohongiella sp.]|tara:strand:- start:67505 stop:68044 length:540 start_codon:yes stop_codon:yes gene_type:complete